jgi:hypothetical protein
MTKLYFSKCTNLKEGFSAMIEASPQENSEERSFEEFRRKVRSAELLSAATQRLLQAIHFTGRLSLLLQNGQVLKSGYEEGYFRQPEPGVTARLQ